MHSLNDAFRFLQAIFPNYLTSAIFANLDPQQKPTRDYTQLDSRLDCYWSIAAFPPGVLSNCEDNVLDVRTLVIDDVGTKGPSEAAMMVRLGAPTTIVETSPGNFQYGYRLSKPVAVADWPGFFGGIEAVIGHAVPLEARACQTLMRLPMGVNTKGPDANGKMKLGHGGTFKVRLVAVDASVVLDPDTIQRAAVASRASFGGNSQPAHSVRDICGLMALIPNNDVHYDDWFAHMERTVALAVDEATALEGFTLWSEKSSKHDPAEIALRWSSVDPTRTSGKELLLEAERADPEGYRAWLARESASAFDDGEEPPEDRQVAFQRGANNQILATMDNAARALWGLKRECTYDEFHHRFYVGTEKLTDHVVLLLRVEINNAYGKDFGDKHVLDAITALALRNGGFNPVTGMLAEAEKAWDGVKRLDRLGPDYFHSEDTALARRCFRKTMIAAVRRARRPGCKFDHILVIESPEGWDKSTAWRMLAGDENFSDASILGKDARAVQEELADVWIHEIADLAGLKRADVDEVKSFASRLRDRARPAYGKVLIDQPRQSIEVGTTNSDSYLMSTTGNRRFWPFRLKSRVDTEALRRDRLLLWGEAAAAESGGESLVLDKALWDAAAVAQDERRVIDPWEDELANLPDTLVREVDGEQTITNVAIHEFLKGHRGAQLTGASGRTIAGIMKQLGWERSSKLKDALGNKVRGYKRPIPVDGTDKASSVPVSVPKNPF